MPAIILRNQQVGTIPYDTPFRCGSKAPAMTEHSGQSWPGKEAKERRQGALSASLDPRMLTKFVPCAIVIHEWLRLRCIGHLAGGTWHVRL